MTVLADMQCSPGAPLLEPDEAENRLSGLESGWQLSADRKAISRVFRFANYYETIAFVNLIAAVAHRQDHHPDLGVGYNRCVVEFSTHSAGGLTDNDFICAARIDRMLSI